LNLVNELARQLSCSRVSLGWIRGRSVRLVAMSDTEHLKRHSEQVANIELSMAECLDQQQPIAYPIPAQAEPLIQQAVVHAHRKMAPQPNQHVLSLPLRHRDEWIGVITLERSEPFDPNLIQYLQLVTDVLSPQLDDRRDGDRPLYGHAWRSIEKAATYVVGPKHVAWKLGAIALIAVIAVLLFGSWQYRVSAPFVFEAYSRRVLPAPFEGRIKAVNVEPGRAVKAGQILAQLETTELNLQLVEAQKKARLASLEKSQKLAEGKQAEYQQAKANEEQYNAQGALLEYQIEQATIRSPVDGWVLAGQWYDKVGNVIRQGDQMFEVAPLTDLVALLHVGESDITQIDAVKPQTGRLATRSVPEETFEFKTWRVVPAATPVNGVNSFDVRAKLDEVEWNNAAEYPAKQMVVHEGIRYRALSKTGPSRSGGAVVPGTNDAVWARADWLRPGMEGIAKVDAGSRPMYWILTHRITDAVRLWMWW
jgi:multidrug efflux pump subunit AcrA (membrane-fusion protein)